MRYITEYKSSWPQSFEEIARVIRVELPKACEIHHVGSTAIPGMPSKDIIDVDVECPEGAMAAVIQALAQLGYEHQGDKGIEGREAFRALRNSVADGLPPHHLYVCEESALELHKHLAFRDFLVTHGDRMTWLAGQKRLADQTACSRDEYIQKKAQAYATIAAEALGWASDVEKRT